VIVDGIEGVVIVDPTDEELDRYRKKQTAFAEQKKEWAKLKDEPTLTADGEQVDLGGNIGTPEDDVGVLDNGGEAVGLYRTEFLYMDKNELTTEDEQYEAYKTVIEQMNGNPVVVSPLDLSEDNKIN